MNWCICQILDVDLFKRLVVILNNEGMTKDIGVESFCSENTGEQFMFCVGIMLLHSFKSFESKGNWAAILKKSSTLAFLGCIDFDNDRLVNIKVLQCGILANQRFDFVKCFLIRVIPEEFCSLLQQLM